MKQDAFVMRRYAQQPPFASFLPGIAGEWGIPVWCYYCNRGQAVSSFGVRDKDHAIMEFSPAHVAYQNTHRTGFRTFLRWDGQITEAFRDGGASMTIRQNGLSLRWKDGRFAVDVQYFVMPGCGVGALARQVRIKNLGAEADVTALDGMPALVPAGVGQDALKNMTQLAKAWMQVEDAGRKRPWYRVRYSMEDSAVIHEIREGNFALGMTEDGTLLAPVVDPAAVFGCDTGLEEPRGFLRAKTPLAGKRQSTSNLFPCAFFERTAHLKTGESLIINELFGGAGSKDALTRFLREEKRDGKWFARKRAEADALTDRLTLVIAGSTADPTFDAYARQSYLDNLLRGGEPIRFRDGEKQNIFYLYSRKHGDMEREYNYFVMSPEHFSQGNGNFRDVAQNRRCDVRFHPWVGDADIRLFFSLLQADGYNPLIIDRMTFSLSPADREEMLSLLPARGREAAAEVMEKEFTPGQLAGAAKASGVKDPRGWTEKALARAQAEPNAQFGEGYWTDHWTYSLDLIENFLAVWPEKKEALLFGAADYPWYESRARVLPREERVSAGKPLRQVRFLEMKENAGNKWMREESGRGNIARSTLAEKMILLCAVKFAARDRLGVGLEMEAGKPGWYDALNGLPGIFGSCVADACELLRLIRFTAGALEEKGGEIALYDEMTRLLRGLAGKDEWKKRMDLLESYRRETARGVAGMKTVLSAREAARILREFEGEMARRLQKAAADNGGICPAYLSFRPDGPLDEKAPWYALPLFLEGPARWLKTGASPAEKREMVRRVRGSGLYDEKLGMYKVNESLQSLTFEAGRCKAFTPGWLENESIWLHMEYKYLLELLRSGLYQEYEDELNTALIPFLDPKKYGRSPYENVSFIASSANPDPACRGRGFVARLSGSTAEFLSMWQEMMFGQTPFAWEGNGLVLRFAPMLPARLIPEDGAVEAAFLGGVRVRYHIPGRGSLIPGQYTVSGFELDGEQHPGGALRGEDARAVRRGDVREIDVYIKR